MAIKTSGTRDATIIIQVSMTERQQKILMQKKAWRGNPG